MSNQEVFNRFLDNNQNHFDELHRTPKEVSASFRKAIERAFSSFERRDVSWYDNCVYRSFGRTLLEELMQVYPDRVPVEVLLNALAEYRDILTSFTGEAAPINAGNYGPEGKLSGSEHNT